MDWRCQQVEHASIAPKLASALPTAFCAFQPHKALSHRSTGEIPYLIIWLDFNAPHARNSAALPKLMQFIASIAGKNASRSCSLQWMPDTAKENLPLDKEVSAILDVLNLSGLHNLHIHCNTRTFGIAGNESLLPMNFVNP